MIKISALAGINGNIYISTSPPAALGSPETFNDSGDHIHYFRATHDAWDQTKTLTVQCSPNGTTGWVTVTDYEFYWPVGEIVFASARSVGVNDHVRVSAGSYFTLAALSGAHAWKAMLKAATKECTEFQPVGNFATYTPTTKSTTFNVDCYKQDAQILNEMVTGVGGINTSGGVIVCQLFWDQANGKRWQFFGLPTGVDTTVAANDIDKQAINFTATGPIYQILSNTFSTTNVKRL